MVIFKNDSDTASSNAMTIKDIAKLAGVSIATVSKVLNNKDQDISEETRRKITNIISEHNYIPYRKVVKRLGGRSDTLGLIISSTSEPFCRIFTRGFEAAAVEQDMNVIHYMTEGEEGRERRGLEVLQERNVNGIMIVPTEYRDELWQLQPMEDALPIAIVAQGGPGIEASQISLDYKQGTYAAVAYLLNRKHERIGFIGRSTDGGMEADKLEGYKMAIYDQHIRLDKTLIYESVIIDDKELGYEGAKYLISMGVTAIVTSNDVMACGVYSAASEQFVQIPRDLSVIGCGDSSICNLVTPTLSSIAYPYYEMGYAAAITLISQIRNQDKIKQLSYDPVLAIRQSVADPSSADSNNKESIVIVGSLNMDIVMRVPHLPKVGETMLASNIKNAAGGKGANQAVGAGKLGGKVHMIGRVGNDIFGRELYNSLIKNGVDASAVVYDEVLPTGNAYIYVSDNGDNNIVVNPGANTRLSVEQVQEYEWIFDKVSYCLVQMEIPMDTINYVASICRTRNIKLIIKPAPAHHIKFEHFEDSFLIVPNETELTLMIPEDLTLEEKAYRLLAMNFQNVIVTLGERGCLFVNKETKQYFAAADFKAIDTTAGSDSFISGLTIALSEGKSMVEAIRFGCLAAGITVSREGAQPSLPDQETIRLYM